MSRILPKVARVVTVAGVVVVTLFAAGSVAVASDGCVPSAGQQCALGHPWHN